MNKVKNPFRFGDPVDGDYFLPRNELAHAVTQFLESRIPVVLIGPRRFGKTSFVLNLLTELEKKSYTCLFVDIFNISSHRDFLQQLIRALKPKQSKVKAWFESIPKWRPKISAEMDPHTGHPSLGLSLDIASEKDIKEMIQDFLVALEKIGERIVLTIDEFQKITELNDQGWLEATLRTHMQQMRKTSFLFTGSRRSIIYDMLNNQSKPFYRSCQPIEFPSFGEEFTDWILKRFSGIEVACEKKAVEHLRALVQDTPNYVQMVCFHLVAQGKKHVTSETVENTLETVVRQNSYTYQTLLNSLSAGQQRALRLAAAESRDIFTKELLAKYEISSAPALASSIKSLKEKGILDGEGTTKGAVTFDDPLFALWLRYVFAGC